MKSIDKTLFCRKDPETMRDARQRTLRMTMEQNEKHHTPGPVKRHILHLRPILLGGSGWTGASAAAVPGVRAIAAVGVAAAGGVPAHVVKTIETEGKV